jgi:hypothetical protein
MLYEGSWRKDGKERNWGESGGCSGIKRLVILAQKRFQKCHPDPKLDKFYSLAYN